MTTPGDQKYSVIPPLEYVLLGVAGAVVVVMAFLALRDALIPQPAAPVQKKQAP